VLASDGDSDGVGDGVNWIGRAAMLRVSGVGRGVVVVALVRRARWLCSRLSVTAGKVGCGVAAVSGFVAKVQSAYEPLCNSLPDSDSLSLHAACEPCAMMCVAFCVRSLRLLQMPGRHASRGYCLFC
jgi:hypothetical protein